LPAEPGTNDLSATFEQALGHHQSGHFREAEALYREILKAEPENADALHLLGVAVFQAGRGDEAVGFIERSLHRNPGNADALNNLGQVYEFLDRTDDAIDAYRKAVAAVPGFAPALANLGDALLRTGEAEEAVDCFVGALKTFTDDPDVLGGLGKALAAVGRADEAVARLRRARDMAPEDPAILCNLGTALQAKGDVAEAEAAFEAAVAADPDFAEGHYNLGVFLHDQGRFDDAVRSYRRALDIKPDDPAARVNLGKALHDQGRLNDAIAVFEGAIDADPGDAAALNNLGNALENLGRLDEALAAYGRAVAVKPDLAEAHSNSLICAQLRKGITAAELKTLHAEWDARHGRVPQWPTDTRNRSRDPEKRLRIGLVSPDLGRHPIGYFVHGLLDNHASENMELICYAGGKPDDLSERLRAASDGWVDTRGVDDKALAARVDADGIDVLVDLVGHFTKNRLKLFARRPAPVQATWGGYTGTTGLAAMDYLIADPHSVPEGTDRDYTEEVIRLPDGCVCYTAPDYAPGVGPPPAAANGFITFGCFNKPCKINAEVLAAWAEILNAVPESRLLLKFRHMESPDIREPFSASLSAHGVDLGRVDFEGHSPHKELLDRYNGVDIALDTFPYSGGLTTCEALWMGVPVVTLPAETFASRHSLAHLSAAGLAEYVASDLSGYVRLAAELAGDHSRLAETRAGLRERVARSPLCDGPRFARHFAAAMRTSWHRFCDAS
jgi:predicted O-linked N-acetylglucosamine transferase (SPINDLY family)